MGRLPPGNLGKVCGRPLVGVVGRRLEKSSGLVHPRNPFRDLLGTIPVPSPSAEALGRTSADTVKWADFPLGTWAKSAGAPHVGGKPLSGEAQRSGSPAEPISGPDRHDPSAVPICGGSWQNLGRYGGMGRLPPGTG